MDWDLYNGAGQKVRSGLSEPDIRELLHANYNPDDPGDPDAYALNAETGARLDADNLDSL